jgi:hypothetical protein
MKCLPGRLRPVWGGDRFVTRKNFAFLAGRRGAVEVAPFLLKISFCEFCGGNDQDLRFFWHRLSFE